MRKYKKKLLLENLEEIYELHKEFEKSLPAGKRDDLLRQLAQCQELAIRTGNELDGLEGKEHMPASRIVKILEAYCEALYQASLNMQETTDLQSRGRQRSSLDFFIREAEERIRKDIPERVEAVFLPYKASMWDSLESVWMSADQDGECDSYVIPVPYFDRNADGSLGEMHYEGGDFPEYVPVTDWQEYDIAARHPDMIFIHNPYDGTNRVTTVHPSFYAKELKNYTDMLVYIPYFVCMDSDVPAHFCVMPGTIHADRVVVQSEKARQIYIKEFRKFEREYNCRGKFGDPEKKFLALGSPKFDKVLSTTRENVEIPEEWKRKIVREDGSERKVLLYNTSVSKLLEGKEKTLEKIRSVLALMKELEEIVLLWRPHPLSGSTYAAERPQLLEEYEGLVEAYKMEDWGIFDDSPDVDRAIAISDAYYGDKSSLVELCRVTGKPVMIQDVEIASD